MKYSYRPVYLEIESKGKAWAMLYIAADLAYYFSLLGGLIGGAVWLSLPILHHEKPQHWSFYVIGFLITVVVAFVALRASEFAMQFLLRRLKIKEQHPY